MNSWALKSSLLVLAFPALLSAQGKPDLVIFDDDDPGSAGYYDASYGFRTAPSSQLLGGTGSDKLTIITSNRYSGNDAGVIQWTSAPNGNWGMFIASVLWQGKDASAHDSIVFFLNGPVAIASSALPKVNLESTTNAKATGVDLETYLSAGVDGDPATWQRVSIPLTAFQPFGTFSLSIFKDVNFSQKLADNVQHTMWIDNIRIIAKVAFVDSSVSQIPARVVTRSGDQSIVLHWNRNLQSNLSGFNIYRASSRSGPYANISTSLSVSPGFVDFDVTNGQARWYYVRSVTSQGESASSDTVAVSAKAFAGDNEFLDYLEATAFDYFWYEANPLNGLVRDRSQAGSASSVAAVGFGLTAYGIGSERGWITRAEAADRTLTTLKTFWNLPQGPAVNGVIGYKGWFYHFLDMETGLRAGDNELSSIDTGLLMAGVLYVREFFDGSDSVETKIRGLADSLFGRIDWNWMRNNQMSLTMGWFPTTGFLSARWIGYNEAMVLNIMAIGATTNPAPPQVWNSWTSGYGWFYNNWLSNYYVAFPPLFGHQYSHCWVDFRNIADAYMRAKGIDYFENSRRATIAQRNYCIDNPGMFTGYSGNVWGLTACDGPSPNNYMARGTNFNDDGTIAPTAPGGSIPFAPEICIPTLKYLYNTYRTQLWTPYGFRDAFNLTKNWWGPDEIGIDEGPILLMAENYRTQSVWRTSMKSSIIQQGLQRAGFTLTTEVADAATLPGRFELAQNYPNPFNPSTTISYELPSPTLVVMRVFDLLGREIATLVHEVKAAGRHQVLFDAANLPTGTYFYRLQTASVIQTRHMVLIR